MAKYEQQTAAHNLISAGTSIKGEIKTDGDFRIDGCVEGDIISSGRIIVGSTGKIKGTVKAKNIDILGSIEGDINISEVLSLKSSGKINGNIQTTVLDIEQKAEFNGTCKMNNSNASNNEVDNKNNKKK